MNKETALQKLIDGNKRYTADKSAARDISQSRRTDLADNGQHPFALIVGCSDSRVPPELIFDCGLGELFVVRTAGNVVDEFCMGSIEYGAEHLHLPVIVVLGHEGCGAVQATVNGGEVHGCLGKIMEHIGEAHKTVAGAENVYTACEDENIRRTVRQIEENPVIKELLGKGETCVIGAKYGLCDGAVSFFDM